AGKLAVGVDVVIELAELHITGGQDQVRVIDRANQVHQAQLVRLELVRVGVHHDLAVAAAEGLRHAGARYAGHLVAYLELRQIAQGSLVESLALKGDQTDWQTRSIKLQNHRRQGSRRQPAQLGHGQVGNGCDVGIGVSPWLEVNLDDTHSGQRARLDVLDTRAQGEEPLEPAGDIGFDLLGGHAGIERRDHDYRDVHRWKHVHRHLNKAAHSDHPDNEADNNNEVGITNGKSGHTEFLWLTIR